MMALRKEMYSFKDKTWYIVPWSKLDPDIPELRTLPSYLVHNVNGHKPHGVQLWTYSQLTTHRICRQCGAQPSKRIQTLWTLENMDNPSFFENF